MFLLKAVSGIKLSQITSAGALPIIPEKIILSIHGGSFEFSFTFGRLAIA